MAQAHGFSDYTLSTTDYSMCAVRLGLANLDLDVLVYIIGFLDVPDVISFRQASPSNSLLYLGKSTGVLITTTTNH